MPRKPRHKVNLDSVSSLTSLVQEAYNDTCLQLSKADTAISELKLNTQQATEVEDITKVSREISNLLKVKDSAIKIKIEIAKIQNDIIKKNNNIDPSESGGNLVKSEDFDAVRKLIMDAKKSSPKKTGSNEDDDDE